ncbi:MAG: hypothetical protein ACR2NO_12780 [Chloroflexota bacterium]
MVSTYAPPTRRFPLGAAALPHPWQRSSSPLILLVATVVFIVTALAFLIPQTGAFSRSLTVPSAPSIPAQLAPEQIEGVLAYARGMQPDDALVEVRPGIFAKRSNVHGVTVDGTTVYYDVASHQSFGPLRSGKLTEAQINVVGREAQPGFLILVYTKK